MELGFSNFKNSNFDFFKYQSVVYDLFYLCCIMKYLVFRPQQK
jgi:hypothetical protein